MSNGHVPLGGVVRRWIAAFRQRGAHAQQKEEGLFVYRVSGREQQIKTVYVAI